MKNVAAHVKANGMDGVFCSTNMSNQTVALLEKWSQMTMNEVTSV